MAYSLERKSITSF